MYMYQGRIQDFVLGGTKVGEGSPAGPGFEYLGRFSSTILKHFVNVMKCIKTHESSPKSFK